MCRIGGGVPSAGRDIGRLERSRTADLALRRRGSESIGEADIGADDGNRTRRDFVGNDVSHLADIRMLVGELGIEPRFIGNRPISLPL